MYSCDRSIMHMNQSQLHNRLLCKFSENRLFAIGPLGIIIGADSLQKSQSKYCFSLVSYLFPYFVVERNNQELCEFI